MTKTFRGTVAPAYLFACLILGGSAQGIWSNMLLQIAGVAIIAWAALAKTGEPLLASGRQLLILVILGLLVVAIQLVPLPAALWPHLGGRERLSADIGTLGLPMPAMPISLSPYDSLATLFAIIPALALLCAMIRMQAYRLSWLAIALVAGTLAGVLLGILQVSGGLDSPWYLYERTNRGVATGFFANANHMATLLVTTLPFLAALVASARGSKAQRYSAVIALAGGTALIVLVGLALNQSLAGYALAVPVLVGSALILLPSSGKVRAIAGIGSGVLLLAAVAALWMTPVSNRSLGAEASSSVQSRERIAETSAQAARAFLPLGSGLGTFRDVYKLYEDHDRLGTTVVNHAHNDYLELALETGVPGLAVVILFLAWWASNSWSAWRSAGLPYSRAAAIASAAIFAHSLVDFPLRTAAIGAVFAMCLGLLIERRHETEGDQSELWPTRHLVLD